VTIETKMHFKGLVLLLITITVITAAVFAWSNAQISNSVQPINVVHREKSQGLGSTIYDQASNPLSNNTPDTNPVKVTNPFDTYQNPFSPQ